MRTLLVVSALFAAAVVGPLSTPLSAQSPEDQVRAVVDRLFEGMRMADTTMMRSTMHPDIRLITTGMRDGQPVAGVVPVENWLAGVAGADQVLDERLYDTEIRVSDNLASVWTYYTLHVGDRFSHCGYDAFQLVRTADGWKITQVADTRQREGCRMTERGP